MFSLVCSVGVVILAVDIYWMWCKPTWEMAVHMAVSDDVFGVTNFVLSLLSFPTEQSELGRIWDWTASVPDSFPTYFCCLRGKIHFKGSKVCHFLLLFFYFVFFLNEGQQFKEWVCIFPVRVDLVLEPFLCSRWVANRESRKSHKTVKNIEAYSYSL